MYWEQRRLTTHQINHCDILSVGSLGLVTVVLLKLKMQMLAGCEHAGSYWKEWADSVYSFF